jgi:Mn-dependent DtxR family transcriptional regulator
MMTDRERSFAVLLALFDLSRAGLPCTRERIAGRLGLNAMHVSSALSRLERVGLVHRARLSLTGLALASSLDRARANVSLSFAA